MSKQHAKDSIMRKHIEQWQESGLTQTEYCRQAGIKRDNFNYYKQKFSKTTPSAMPKSQLVPVTLLEDIEPVCQTVTISHCNGFSLDINMRDDISHFEPLLKLLSHVS